MPQTFKIDQAATFDGVILLSVEPKLAFGSTEQDRTKDGLPKWEAQVVAGFKAFDRTNNEVLKIGLANYTNPMEGLTPYTPVTLVDFEVGVMARERRNKETGASEMTGVQIWYRCGEIRSTASTGSARRPHIAESA
ncbi:MAG: hypothetical protein LC749_14340 [Actinobacteria bacterium]|nr:hypothetical protein [Actinomycetota bacterium]